MALGRPRCALAPRRNGARVAVRQHLTIQHKHHGAERRKHEVGKAGTRRAGRTW